MPLRLYMKWDKWKENMYLKGFRPKMISKSLIFNMTDVSVPITPGMMKIEFAKSKASTQRPRIGRSRMINYMHMICFSSFLYSEFLNEFFKSYSLLATCKEQILFFRKSYACNTLPWCLNKGTDHKSAHPDVRCLVYDQRYSEKRTGNGLEVMGCRGTRKCHLSFFVLSSYPLFNIIHPVHPFSQSFFRIFLFGDFRPFQHISFYLWYSTCIHTECFRV